MKKLGPKLSNGDSTAPSTRWRLRSTGSFSQPSRTRSASRRAAFAPKSFASAAGSAASSRRAARNCGRENESGSQLLPRETARAGVAGSRGARDLHGVVALREEELHVVDLPARRELEPQVPVGDARGHAGGQRRRGALGGGAAAAAAVDDDARAVHRERRRAQPRVRALARPVEGPRLGERAPAARVVVLRGDARRGARAVGEQAVRHAEALRAAAVVGRRRQQPDGERAQQQRVAPADRREARARREASAQQQRPRDGHRHTLTERRFRLLEPAAVARSSRVNQGRGR